MLHQNETAIKEFQKKETGIMEHPMTEEDLTHPGLYRHKMNSIPCSYSYTKPSNQAKSSNTNSNSSTNDWDLYPGLIRDIVNEGSPEQVEKLQQMQQNL